MKKNHRTEQPYSVDRLMLNVARILIQDFRDVSNMPSFCSSHLEALAKGDVRDIRETVPALDESSSMAFKMSYQIQSLMKRHRFKDDLYSDSELEQEAILKFQNIQNHIAGIDLNTVSVATDLILDRAAMYVRRILGAYSDEEHRSLCRFGRRASVGIPARAATEAARWELPLSGSQEQISWFDSEMSRVDCVQEYWIGQLDSDPNRSIYQETSSLKLALVPKTFKSLRSIMPNTTIGSYMSYGLGMVMRNRLRNVGYDISSLQTRHRHLARRGSIHGQWTTLDLSSASDTISEALVQRLFPPDWFDILTRSRIRVVELPNGQKTESLTFCTMGIGYTFPLQTLVFLSLLLAIHTTMKGRVRGTISVYGDDMIYPSSIHSEVCRVFQEIGFLINVDKTFSDGHFRESCGGDYFHGVDVRPFQPRNGATFVGAKAYEAVLYKWTNNLLVRWTEYEIKETLAYLLSEIKRVAGTAKVVPVSYPDDSGIKCPTLGHWLFLSQRTDVAKPKHLGHGVFRFSYLSFKPDRKEEKRHEPYLWLALRGSHEYPGDSWACSELHPAGHSLGIRAAIDRNLDVNDHVSPLQWVILDQPIRSKISGRRLRRLASVVTVSHTGSYKRQSGTSCFEDRR